MASTTKSTPARKKQQIYIDLTPTSSIPATTTAQTTTKKKELPKRKSQPGSSNHSTSTSPTLSRPEKTPEELQEENRAKEIHQSLAEELFPPSPPPPPPRVEFAPERDRSPSVISDSEPDTPSPPSGNTTSSWSMSRERSISTETIWLGGSEAGVLGGEKNE